MVLPTKFKSYGQGEKGYMGRTSYEMPIASVSSSWPVCFWVSSACQVDIGNVDIAIMWESREYHYIIIGNAMKNEVSVQDMISSATKILLEGISPVVYQ